jgi:hypothetical protein
MKQRTTLRYKISATELMDMARHPDHETEAMLTDLGLIFLESRAAAVDTKVSKRQDRLAHAYGVEGQRLEDDELLAVYHQEQGLIEELIEASRDKPFVQVGPARLERARQQRQQMSWRGQRFDARDRTARYQTHVEQNILTDLLQNWHTWLRSVARGEQAAFYRQG